MLYYQGAHGFLRLCALRLLPEPLGFFRKGVEPVERSDKAGVLDAVDRSHQVAYRSGIIDRITVEPKPALVLRQINDPAAELG